MMTIPLEEALEIVLKAAAHPVTEQVSIQNSLGRVLATNLTSDIDMPPFDKSTVDGFACRMADIMAVGAIHELPQPLMIMDTIPAGKIPEHPIGPRQCARIMTGAIVPEGADAVIMVEDSEETGDSRVILHLRDGVSNIRRCGEDVKKGEVVLVSGTLLKPAHIAVLASIGAINIPVYRRPRVAVISTGDELVEPSQIPGIASIRDSNRFQLISQIQKMDGVPFDLGISRDTEKELREKILAAMESHEVVLLTGGVSMGMYDYVPGILNECGVEILFKSIAIQPGRPTLFGRKGKNYVFGLPGNPVSSFVLFELLVKPFLYKLTGHDFIAPQVRLPMGTTYSRKKSARRSIIPISIRNGEIFPVDYHGSAHINAYISA
ncbi:MAG: gephyrin-like molybdotransferase Glp, partial [bacterium]